jgi:hypothetical protein
MFGDKLKIMPCWEYQGKTIGCSIKDDVSNKNRI